MPRESNARGEGDQLRTQLVDAASALLLRPQAVSLPSLRAVARACSVSPAAVYLHFDSLQALVAAVIDRQLDHLGASMRASQRDAESPADRLLAFALSYAEWGISHPGAYQLLFETADRLQGELADLDHGNWELLAETRRLLAEATALPDDEANAAAFALWTRLHGIVSLRVHKPDAAWPTTPHTDVREAVIRITAEPSIPRHPPTQ